MSLRRSPAIYDGALQVPHVSRGGRLEVGSPEGAVCWRRRDLSRWWRRVTGVKARIGVGRMGNWGSGYWVQRRRSDLLKAHTGNFRARRHCRRRRRRRERVPGRRAGQLLHHAPEIVFTDVIDLRLWRLDLILGLILEQTRVGECLGVERRSLANVPADSVDSEVVRVPIFPVIHIPLTLVSTFFLYVRHASSNP